MKIGIVVPHIFMHQDILPKVIFSPGQLAIALADGLQSQGQDVFLFSPGPVPTQAQNITADLGYFEAELAQRGDTYIELLKKHPLTFISLARQVQSELVAKAFAMANADELDVVHIYTNEEDIALPFVQFCRKPVALTHHDPFNFSAKYRQVFPKYKHLNWLSMSLSQRSGMPPDATWVGNIYHGLDDNALVSQKEPMGDYVAYLGRIIEPKGLHLAIAALQRYNAAHPDKPYRLKIAGKHYAGASKDTYWQKQIQPLLDNKTVQYVGFIKDTAAKQDFLGSAAALLVPSTFDEPFGMVMIEALACGTPIIGLDSGAIPEVIQDTKIGRVVPKIMQKLQDKRGNLQEVVDVAATSAQLAAAIAAIGSFDRQACRTAFEQRFTLQRMCQEHLAVYQKLTV